MPFLQRFELCVTVSVAGYVQPALFAFELSWCRRLNRTTPHTIKSRVNLRHSFVTNYRSAAWSNVLEIPRACKANHHGRDTGYHQAVVLEGVREQALMTTTSRGYGDCVVFVESKALRGRSKQEPSRGDASEIDCAKRSTKGATAGRRGVNI